MTAYSRLHLINFFRKFAFQSIFFLIPLHFIKVGFNGWQIGFVMACFAAAPLIFSFPSGWLNDRFSVRQVIQSAVLLLSLLILLLAWVRSVFLTAALFLCLGMANNALDVSTNSFFYKDGRVMDQNRKYGLVSFWLGLGMAAGTFSGGLLTHYTGFKVLFIASAAFLLGLLLFLRETGPKIRTKVTLREYGSGVFNRKVLLFAAMVFVLALHWGAEGTVYSPFLKEWFGLNNLQVSLYISIPLSVMAVSALLFLRLKFDLRTNRTAYLAAMAVSGLGLILMVNRNVYASFCFRVLHEIGDGVLGVLIGVYISRMFSLNSIGGSSGVLIMIMTAGHVVGALVFSGMGARYGLHWPFLLAGSLLLANSLYGRFVFKQAQY